MNFTSNETLVFGAGGQARIEAQVGTFDDLTISLASGSTFRSLILNIDATTAGTVTFTGIPGGSSGPFTLTAGGQNFFTITGENFASVSFTTNAGVAGIELVSDVQQVRLGPSGTTNVSEPASMALFGTGLLGLGLIGQRWRRRSGGADCAA